MEKLYEKLVKYYEECGYESDEIDEIIDFSNGKLLMNVSNYCYEFLNENTLMSHGLSKKLLIKVKDFNDLIKKLENEEL